MRSMTGFGAGDAPLSGGRVRAEIRSVNQRFLDVRVKLPRELAELGLFAEQVVRERLHRGRVDLTIYTEGTVTVPIILDVARARAAFEALAKLRDEIAPGAEVPLSLLAAVPDLFTAARSDSCESARSSVRAAIERAIEAMNVMQRREGEALRADLRARSREIRAALAQIKERAALAIDALRRRLSERTARLFDGADSAIDPARLATEIVLIADRSDVSEEITRLGSHLDQLASAIDGEGEEPAGKRIDFLLQEMLRETSTIGSKAQDAAIAAHVVTMKVEIERMREQIQNVA